MALLYVNMSILLFFLMITVMSQFSQVNCDPVIEKNPLPLNISLNGNANFSCRFSEPAEVYWYANSQPFQGICEFNETDYNETQVANSSAMDYSVLFPVEYFHLADFNMSNITCLGISKSTDKQNKSAPALLLVQGKLDAPTVTFAEVNGNSSSFNLSWNPPYKMDNVDISGYWVNITVNQSSNSSETFTDFVEQNNFTFPLIDQNACTTYSALVQAKTEAGLGDVGLRNTSYKVEAPKKLEAKDTGVDVKFTQENIILQYEIKGDDCVGRQASTLTATVNYTTNVTSSGIIPADLNENGNTTFSMTIPKSITDGKVVTVVTLTNDEGFTESEPKETAILYIENVILAEDDSSVSVQCHFSFFGSDAKGCHVKFFSAVDNDTHHELNLSVQADSNKSEAQPVFCKTSGSVTEYNVYAYIIKQDDTIGDLSWYGPNKKLCEFYTGTPVITPAVSPSTSPITGLSAGVIVGIAIGLFMGVIIFFIGAFLLGLCQHLSKKKHSSKFKARDSDSSSVQAIQMTLMN